MPSQDELYQVHVTVAGKHLPVGPRLLKDVAESFCFAIGVEISAGRELHWSNPRIERVAVLKGV